MRAMVIISKIFRFVPLLTLTIGLAPHAGGSEPPAAQHPLEAYKGVVLQKIVGGIAKVKPIDRIEDCKINSDHAEIKGRLHELGGLIDAASKSDFNTAFHFMAQVPSVEIYVTRVSLKAGVQQTEKILLLQDYETLKTRNGKEAQSLIDLVNKLCPTPAPAETR